MATILMFQEGNIKIRNKQTNKLLLHICSNQGFTKKASFPPEVHFCCIVCNTMAHFTSLKYHHLYIADILPQVNIHSG